ncbi:MAG: 1-deoxy-D-xylulose-5-phosphate synthase [Defluviitaleaceae bacterium]|nr:1-deoxy-D-xylulose-5-phosphate synthase [Defluviitaleaceae bacterium]
MQKLKTLPPSSLNKLADEIRDFLITSLSDTGGHLASNLGVVELTLALHAVYDTPRDSIVWDVGHQAYVHKILTGRRSRFNQLRKLDGLSGFPKINESEHDAFGTGHSSTAISAALGLAKARDLCGGENEHIIAVVGDGSLTGGLAYEGLNNAGRASTDLLVILNDNQMSISKNVGAVARHLNSLRTAPVYLGAKEDVHKILDKMPLLGASLTRGIESAKDLLKYAILQGVLFEELGFRYLGPVDGHNLPELIKILRQVKKIKGPVLLHVLTTKGKGYNAAEKSPRSYHGVGTFCVETGVPKASQTQPTYTDIFSKYICRAAAKDKKIVAITAAMHDGTGLSLFKKHFPERFFDVGIAEAHAVTFAAGLAKKGMKPVFAVYSSFLQRAYDQILHDVAVQGLPVIFAIDHAGAVGGDGETHQGIFDIPFLSHIPNMTILAPANGKELTAMFDYALAQNSPVAIRYPKEIATQAPKLLQDGQKIAIVSVGTMHETAKQVLEKIPTAGLYDAGFVKPLDKGLLAKLEGYEAVFTIEDGAVTGGFGQQLAMALQNPTCHALGFPDIFPETGTRTELFTRYHLDAESIYNKIIKI